MIIIKNEKDIKKLKKGDQFLIKPLGLDYDNPESILKIQNEVIRLENIIYDIFSTEKEKKEGKTPKKEKK
jgi:hypothetical protein